MLRVVLAASCQILILLSAAPAVLAQDSSSRDQNVFILGGRFTDQFFEYSFNPFGVSYEDNYVIGGGYQQFFLGNAGGPRLGLEAGTALRFGDSITSGEVWGGVVARYDGLIATDHFRISASVSTGISGTTGTVGVEADRATEEHGDSSLLFYLGPEISISSADNPNLEVFWRVHHRSGAWETLGSMHDGANANTIGVRWSF
jgi:hypothetical protein